MPRPLTPEETDLIAKAEAVIDAVPRFTNQHTAMHHSVSCGVLTSTGCIFTGINVFHFTGGPCAENVAFSNAAAGGVASVYTPGVPTADGKAETLLCCVAVRSEQRGVISPCGRCRQHMLDYYPDIRVIVRVDEGLVTVGTDELLPFPYTLPKVPILP